MKILRESIGVDVSKGDFKYCIAKMNEHLEVDYTVPSSMYNNSNGVQKIIKRLDKEVLNKDNCCVVMEATGVYHELLAYTLHESGYKVSILLPNKAQAFIKSINQRAKTDEIDSKLLCQMGIERILDAWVPPAEIYRILKSLTREKESLTKEKIVIKNKVHAREAAYHKAKTCEKRLKQRLKLLEKQIISIEKEIELLVKSQPELDEKVRRISAVKGLSKQTIVSVIAETHGFNLIRNQKQLIGYAGLDVRIHQSGLMKKSGKISKKGNSFLRKAMFMPAMSSCHSNEEYQLFYQQLNERQSSKKQGIIAVARKMLILIYALWKNGNEYNPIKNIENRLQLTTV